MVGDRLEFTYSPERFDRQVQKSRYHSIIADPDENPDWMSGPAKREIYASGRRAFFGVSCGNCATSSQN